MLVQNIVNSKKEPTKSPKLLLIYSEGEKREKGYINFFKQRCSQVILEIETVSKAGENDSNGNNSPTGLFLLAKKHLCGADIKYDLDEDDEVWFLIDTDKWEGKIKILRDGAKEYKWNVVQSNPCFEVWLYYHHFSEKPSFENFEKSKVWKEQLNQLVRGGFNSKKHPLLIETAIINAKKNHEVLNNEPIPGCTDVFMLGNTLYEFTKDKLI